MADSVQAKARIQIDTDLGRDVLLATGIIGQEAISRPYVYNLTLISKDFDIHPEQILGTKVGNPGQEGEGGRVSRPERLCHGFRRGRAARQAPRVPQLLRCGWRRG